MKNDIGRGYFYDARDGQERVVLIHYRISFNHDTRVSAYPYYTILAINGIRPEEELYAYSANICETEQEAWVNELKNKILGGEHG